MKSILITGAGGFIGGHLVRQLLSYGYVVRGSIRPGSKRPNCTQNFEVVEADVQNHQAMKNLAMGVDTVFHLAGKAHDLSEVKQDEKTYWSINVEGTRHLLEGAAAAGAKRFVFFSSVKVMGETAAHPLDESYEPRPANPYGKSKLAAEQIVQDYGKQTGIHVVCLRLPLVYGPGNKGNLFKMILGIDRGFFPLLPETGNRRSLVHVSNVVDAAVQVAINPLANGQSYNVTDSRPYSTRELFEKICNGLGKQVPRWHIPLWMFRGLARLGDVVGRIGARRFVFNSAALEKLIGSAFYSSAKISRELGYYPSVTLEDALPELIAWYRKSQP